MSKKYQKFSNHILILSLISFPITLYAELQIIPRLDLSEIYTDNVTFAPLGMEESDYITRIAPAISIRERGRRNTLDFFYRLEHFIYASDSERNATYQQLRGNFNTELVRENFFIDVNAAKYQTVIDSQRPVYSNVTLTDNRTDVESLGISPYLLFPISNFAQSELRYRHDKLNYDDDNVTDSVIRQGILNIRSNQRSSRVGWLLAYEKQEIDYENTDNDVITEDASLELRYRLNPSFAVLGTTGNEKYEYPGSPGIPDVTNSYWNAGFIWDMTSRTTLELRRGERFYGDTYYGSLTSRSRFSTWGLVYSESFTSAAEQQISSGNPVPDDGDIGVIQPPPGSGTLTVEPFIEKRAELNYQYDRGFSGLQMNLYDVKREYQITNGEEKEYGGQALINWQLMPRTMMYLRGYYRDLEVVQTGNRTITREGGARVTKQLASDATAYLEYRRVHVEYTEFSTTSVENIAELTLELTF